MSKITKCLRTTFTAGESDVSIFLITLCTDGSGIIYDCDYQETVEFSHKLDLAAIARAHDHIVLAAYNPAHDRLDIGWGHPEPPTKIYQEEDLAAINLSEIFWDHNDELQNPVGECPEDEPLTVDVGTVEEFQKVLAAISYLAKQAGLDDSFSFYTGSDGDDGAYIEECADPIVNALVDDVLGIYCPNASSYDYIDENDGRITAYSAGGSYVTSSADDIEHVMPAARERLEACRWLEETLRKHTDDLSAFTALTKAIDKKRDKNAA
jgi:hypothetical protein